MAHKKGVGSSTNGRDSHSQRLGVKVHDGQFAKGGSILVRQRGTKMHPGTNVRRANDDSLYTTIDGVVRFEKGRLGRVRVACYPQAPEAPAAS
jgi:large subunit ribosomal protein L27